MIEYLERLMEYRHFERIRTNVDSVYLYYHRSEDDIGVVLITEKGKEEDLSKEQYQAILKQVKSRYEGQAGNVRFLSIICSSDLGKAREIWEYEVRQKDEVYWVIDTASNRLVIYEDQDSEFFDLRPKIENLLSGLQSREFIPYEHFAHEEYTTKKKVNLKKLSICTILLVAINVFIFIAMEVAGPFNYYRIMNFAKLSWQQVYQEGEYYRIITYMFMHQGIDHIFNNMLVLFFLGSLVEKELGKFKYLVLYFASGIIAAVTSMSYNMLQGDPIASVGASGAIFGVIGALLYIVIANRGQMREMSTGRLLFFVFLSLYGGFTSQGTDNMAHVGGIVAGFIFAALLYRKRRKGNRT